MLGGYAGGVGARPSRRPLTAARKGRARPGLPGPIPPAGLWPPTLGLLMVEQVRSTAVPWGTS